MTQENNPIRKEEQLHAQNETLQKIEIFYKENGSIINGLLFGVIIIVGGIWAYYNLYLAPMEEEGQAQIFRAQQYFEQDSFNLALNGDGSYLGFIDIADEYGAVKAGNLANYYAGISYLNLGNYESAIEYLKEFDSDDIVISTLALSGIGDAYMEMDDIDKAQKYYEKAVDHIDNNLLSPMIMKKLALTLELKKNYKDAAETYRKIKKEYPNSTEAKEADKYIAMYEAMSN